MPALIRRLLAVCASLLVSSLWISPAAAQAPPPRIGPWVFDFHATVPRFPKEKALADSRGLTETELPGRGFGLQLGAHFYPWSWKAVTFGLGVEMARARAHRDPVLIDSTTGAMSRPVTSDFTQLSPQLSLNFGSGNGWSYLSAGLAPGTWSIVPDGAAPAPPDVERVQVFNYGGGARWFNYRHLAFSLDVRFYGIDPTTAVPGYPASPRTRMLVIGAGISLK